MPYVSKQFLVLGEYIIRSIIVLVLYVALIAIKIPCNIKKLQGGMDLFHFYFSDLPYKKIPPCPSVSRGGTFIGSVSIVGLERSKKR